MEDLYHFIQKQNKLKSLSELIGKEEDEMAQKTLYNITLERALYFGVCKKNNVENEIDHPLKIYVAGQYTPKDVSMHDAARVAHNNTVYAIDMGAMVIDKGHFPYIPHLSHFIHLYSNLSLTYDYYIKADAEWLRCCDAIFYYSRGLEHKIGESKGADNELKMAIDSGKTVFFSANEIPRYNKKV